MKKVLIIGGGFGGCSSAHLFSELDNWEVTLVEKNNFLGAGVRTYFHCGHPYTFGPRHFLTQNKKVYDFLDKYCPLRNCNEHEFITFVEQDSEFYNYPINMDDIKTMPDYAKINKQLKDCQSSIIKDPKNLEEFWIASVGNILYEKYVKEYNKKMWLVDTNKKIDTFSWSPKGVALKEGSRAAWHTALSAYPVDINGYNSYFDIATKKTNVLLNTTIKEYNLEKKTFLINGDLKKFDVVINSISIDNLFNFDLGKLQYIGRDILRVILPTEFCFPKDVYFVYYAGSDPFTRIVEYKKLTKYKSKHTLIGIETPSNNGQHYPLPFKSAISLAHKYFAKLPSDYYSIGRIGSYQYTVDIDDCIEQSMRIVEAIKNNKSLSYPVPECGGL